MVTLTTESLVSSLAPLRVLAEFSEPVVGFDINDVRLVGGRAANFIALINSRYQFDVFPLSSMEKISVSINEGAAVDFSSNPSIKSDVLEIVYGLILRCCVFLNIYHSHYF